MFLVSFMQIATVTRRLAVGVLLFGVLAGAINAFDLYQNAQVGKLLAKFDLNQKASFASWYSTCLLLLAGCLAVLAARGDGRPAIPRFRRQWLLLALLMFALSADEVVGIHGALSGPFRRLCKMLFGFYHPSLNPAVILAPFFCVIFLPFLRHLPHHTGWLFAGAGTLYLTGAVGLEWLASDLARIYGKKAAYYQFLNLTEEVIEITGIVLFVHILCRHLTLQQHCLVLQSNAPATRQATENAQIAAETAPQKLPA